MVKVRIEIENASLENLSKPYMAAPGRGGVPGEPLAGGAYYDAFVVAESSFGCTQLLASAGDVSILPCISPAGIHPPVAGVPAKIKRHRRDSAWPELAALVPRPA